MINGKAILIASLIVAFSTKIYGQVTSGPKKEIIDIVNSFPTLPIKDPEVQRKLDGKFVRKTKIHLPQGKATTIEILDDSKRAVRKIEITTQPLGEGKLRTLKIKDERSGRSMTTTVKGRKVSVTGDMRKAEAQLFAHNVLSTIERFDKQPAGPLNLTGTADPTESPWGCVILASLAAGTCVSGLLPACVVASGGAACSCETELCD